MGAAAPGQRRYSRSPHHHSGLVIRAFLVATGSYGVPQNTAKRIAARWLLGGFQAA
jgi:hypothetical protein